MDQLKQAAGAQEPGVSLGSILRWVLPLLLIGLVTAALWTMPIWLPAFAERNQSIRVDLEDFQADIRGHWSARKLSESRFAFTRLDLNGRLLGPARSVALAIGKYQKPNQELLSLVDGGAGQRSRISLKLGDFTYEEATPITLGGQKGVKLLGSDKDSLCLRLDFPISQVALLFVTEKGAGASFLDQTAVQTVSYTVPHDGAEQRRSFHEQKGQTR